MRTKNRNNLILLFGILVVVLVVAVGLPGSDGAPPATSTTRERVALAFVNLMETLGLLPTHHCNHSTRNACIANLKMIEGAKATWALENKKTNSELPAATDLYGTNAYIRDEPTCPQGGKYVIGSVEKKPHCSIPGHTI
jgi:hypothetical protein